MYTPTIVEPATHNANEIDFAKYFPLVTAGLILLGVSRLLFYYSFFGINVLSFLEFSEIITSFLDVIVINILMAAIGWILVLRLSMAHKKTTELFTVNKQISYRKLAITTVIILILSISFAISQLYYQKKVLWLYIIAVTISSIFFTALVVVVSRKHKVKLLKNLILVFIILVLSEVLTIFIATLQYWHVRHGRQYIGTRIVFNNAIYLKDSTHTFVSDSSDFYIGQTNKYIFVYHLNEDFTSIYPMSNVVQIDIKRTKHNFVY